MRSSARAMIGALTLASLSVSAVEPPLVGNGVGNADTLISEGSKLFNQKKYPKAADAFFKATRVSPSTVPTYLQLARTWMLGKQTLQACYAYRVFLKASPDTPDRKKAAAESEQCERQLKAMRKPPADYTQKFVDQRAAFFAALDANDAAAAIDVLRSLVKEGFLGPDLADMATKLGAAALAQADSTHKRALALETLSAEELKRARPLYAIAVEVGASIGDAKARMAFLDALSKLQDKEYRAADQLFAEAMRADPSAKEYAYHRAIGLVQAGDRSGALKVMEAELKDDPRTHVLRASIAMNGGAEGGATEVEKLLFNARNPPER